MPQRAFCRRMDVLPSKLKAKPPGLYASRRPFDETRCDKRTRHAVLWWLLMSPTRRRDRKGRSQSHAQSTVAKNATVRTNLARSFCSIFKVAGLGFRSQPHRHSRREVATSAMLPAIKYPLQAHFHVSVLHRKPMM